MNVNDLNLPWQAHLDELYASLAASAGGELCEIRKIHVATPDIFRVDAVSKHVLEMAVVFSRMGFEVELYCDNCTALDRPLFKTLEQLCQSPLGPSDLVIYHHSIGHSAFERVSKLTVSKAVYYHGVTPPELLEKLDPVTAALCRKGIDELKLVSKFDSLAANSQLNLDQAIKTCVDVGVRPPQSVRVLPPFLSLERWDGMAGETTLEASSVPFILAVGRIVPHKNLEAVLEFHAALCSAVKEVELLIVGGIVDGAYLERLKLKAEVLETSSRIRWMHSVDDAGLKALYRHAAALVQFSLHEGFSIPVVEAMKLGTPVVSHAVTALPETLDGSGVLVDASNPGEAAATCLSKIFDPLAKSEVVAVQKVVYEKRFSVASCSRRYAEWFEDMSLIGTR